jgi:hypothetical protein
MKKPIFNNNNKENEKLRFEYKKLKEEFDRYKESISDKLKDAELLLLQNDKIRKENEDLKNRLNKCTQIKTYDKNNHNFNSKDINISLLSRQKEVLIVMLLRILNSNNKNKINKEKILYLLDEKNINKEKERVKFINEMIVSIQEGKKNNIINLRYKNTNIINNNISNNNYNLIKTNFSFQILNNKVNKILYKNNKMNTSYNNINDNLRDKKETELLKNINDMLLIIKKKKNNLKTRKNNLSFHPGYNK